MHDQAISFIDVERLTLDPHYLDEVTRILLDRCSKDADHVELRRMATRLFPGRARIGERWVGVIVGHAATLRAAAAPVPDRDVTEARLKLTATDPIAYPPSYADLDATTRSSLIAFCERELSEGRNGPQALANLLGLHGWPYTERTFYVRPWKAARMRLRRREQ